MLKLRVICGSMLPGTKSKATGGAGSQLRMWQCKRRGEWDVLK